MKITRKHLVAAAAGGAVAGPLDLIAATAQFGVPLDVVCKSVASGWLGREAAMAGGLPVVVLGFASDVFISMAAALVYVVFTPPAQIARPWLNGTLMGLAMFTAMRFLVVPLSAAGQGRMPPMVLAESLLVHAFLWGAPLALVANWILTPRD
ncbi:MAG: hypothetical protein ACOY4K_14285 [Pseudomonadota bacterium]